MTPGQLGCIVFSVLMIAAWLFWDRIPDGPRTGEEDGDDEKGGAK